MKHFLIIVLILIFYKISYAQIFEDICATSFSPLKSETVLNYIDINDISNEPIKYIRVNFVFLRKNDGTGGFQQNNQDHQQYINDMITNLNHIYSTIPSSYDANCYNGAYGLYSDSRIRFDVNVMYINDSAYWDNHNKVSDPLSSNFYLNALDDQIVQSSQEPAINVFFTEDEPAYENIVVNQNCPWPENIGFSSVSHSEPPIIENFSLNQQVHMRNKFVKYYWMMNCVVDNNFQHPDYVNDPPTAEVVYGWMNLGRAVAHELAHSLGLGHVSNNTCPYCTQHLMMNKSCSSGYFLSPLEIAGMHTSLSLSGARKYVENNPYSTTPISITNYKIWTLDTRIYRGLDINSGGKLKLQTNLIIPPETEITVTGSSPSAISKLILAGSNVTTSHTNNTIDISFNQYSEISIENSTISNCSINAALTEFTLENSVIELGSNGEFIVDVGSEFLMTNSTIQ